MTARDQRNERIQQLSERIMDIDVAMFTTTQADGRLASRPLSTQKAEFDGNLWFAVALDSPKVAEIKHNPRVNVAYASASKNLYVSVSGKASVTQSAARIAELWNADMAAFFPGGKDDPNLALIKVAVESAEYWEGPGGMLGKALSFVLGAVTDNPAALSQNETITLARKR